MIPFSPPTAANDDAPSCAVGHSAHSFDDLLTAGLVPSVSKQCQEAQLLHPLAITPVLLDLIDPKDPNDPIARQFIPSSEELVLDEDALDDPIGDDLHSPVAGIIHRYPDRLLLNLVKACPAYCRFCFRRGQVGAGLLRSSEVIAAMDYIRAHDEVWEVILSGGEPLMLSFRRLKEVIVALHSISHVRTIRIHTRAPITIPEKISDHMLSLFQEVKKPLNMMIHCNHPKELSPAACVAIEKLKIAGVRLFSQSVLLKGVNDDPVILEKLMRAFLENGITPYYLHHPDLVHGTRHFRLPLFRGIQIVQSLHDRLSGLCQPRYMLEIPGGQGKINILSSSLREVDGGYMVRSFKGKEFFYKDEG